MAIAACFARHVAAVDRPMRAIDAQEIASGLWSSEPSCPDHPPARIFRSRNHPGSPGSIETRATARWGLNAVHPSARSTKSSSISTSEGLANPGLWPGPRPRSLRDPEPRPGSRPMRVTVVRFAFCSSCPPEKRMRTSSADQFRPAPAIRIEPSPCSTGTDGDDHRG